jgi:3-oxoadipate enol-lactonase
MEAQVVPGRTRWFSPRISAGELDASTTPEIMQGIAERIPGSTYRELPGTPHLQTLSKPSLVADALDAFLPRGNSSGGPARHAQ